MVKAAEYKKKVVKGIVDLVSQYPIIAAINMENLPAPQLQKMRAELRDKVVLTMTKRRLIKLAFEEAKKNKKGIEQLSQHLGGMPALMFSKENPFKLYKILQKSKSPAPAKANQTAPKDIIVPAGPTPFAPGPIIGELAQAGIKSGVEGGKVAIKEDSVVAKKGEKIKPKVAEILTRLGVQPMEVGLDLVAAYEEGTIYTSDILAIDEVEFMNKLQSAALGAFNAAVFVAYPSQKTIEHLISKAANDAKALGISQNIIDKGIVEFLMGKAERGMLGLKDSANIEIVEKKAEEKPKEEKKVEETKPEVKDEEKPKAEPEKPKAEEPKKEEPSIREKEKIKPEKLQIKKEPITKKPIEKKEEPIKEEIKKQEEPKPIEKKEIKALEEEKKIIKEEKKLEEQKPAETPVEKEVQKAVKEEEEKQLEKERIDKEKEIEKIEKQKAEAKTTDDKVADMVAKMKKFGKQPTAEQLVEDVKKEAKKEKRPAKKEVKKKPVKEVPSVQELAEKKEQEKKKEEMESAEQLLEKLKKKGTLRE